MLSLLRTLTTLAWGLWFGGMIALLIFVVRLFGASHETGVIAAPVLFRTFAIYQLIVGSAALLLSVLVACASRSKLAIAAAVVLATAWVTAWPIRSITHSIEAMHEAGQTDSAEFKTLHHRSELLYTGSAACLLLGGLLLPLTSARRV
jgi:hypothetical protein